MIPRSINKRQSSSIVDEWEVARDSAHTSIKEEVEYDSEPESFSEQEYQYLRESVNSLYEQQNSNIQIEDTKMKYRYDGLSVLKHDLECYFEGVEERGSTPQVHICAYHINQKHKHPFLEYFLFKNTKENGDSLHFPRFEYTNSVNTVTKGLAVIELLSMSYYKSAKYVFNGYTNDDNNLYLFFDCSGLELDGFKMSRMNDLWMVTMDEIINQQKVCNFSIEHEVLEFFYNNVDLIFLKDCETGEIYENPTVLYAGCSRKELEFTTTFGVSSSGNDALMGNYYYFTDYKNAVKKAGWLNEPMGCGGLIRCAVFLGKMKVLLNNQDDNVDESKLTQEMLLSNDENSGEHKNIKLLMRVSDRDGLWTENYDSVYLGKLDLDDGSVFNESPLWVVKSYEQQVVLSSQIIDKKTLDSEWNKDSEYFVL